jgi:hypothetical protein
VSPQRFRPAVAATQMDLLRVAVAQFRQAFGNVLTPLREAGGVPEDLVRRSKRRCGS